MTPIWSKIELMSACNASDPTSNFLKNRDGILGISIDDRTIKKGDLFIALIGDKFNGHEFIDSAISKGAYGVMVSDIKLAKKHKGLLVNDTKIALMQIGKFARKRFTGTTIGVTGSSGKTSTKYLLYKSLNQFGKTHKTFGNNNNLIGLSLTLSRLPRDYDFCVLELGMNNSGEIKTLAQIAKPNIALITNVSNSHIKNFKNEKAIAKAKSEIFLGLKNNGIAIINSENIWKHFLISKAKEANAKIHLFGYCKNSNTKIKKIFNEKNGSTIFYDDVENWHLKYLNTTHAKNAIATISVIKELNLPPQKVAKVISNLKPLAGRGKKLKIKFGKDKETIVIDDSYNANPASMQAALKDFYDQKLRLSNYETVIIIGDMLELGKQSIEKHLELVPIIKKINPDFLLTLGKYSEKINDQLKQTINCYYFVSIEQLLKEITQFVRPNQIILLKASNGTGLWKLIPLLKNTFQEKINAA